MVELKSFSDFADFLEKQPFVELVNCLRGFTFFVYSSGESLNFPSCIKIDELIYTVKITARWQLPHSPPFKQRLMLTLELV